MPRNRFSAFIQGANASALASYPISPSDSADLPEVIRAVTIANPGVLAWRGDDGLDYVTATLPAGTYPMRATRILLTGTTATQITGWV